MSDKICLYAEDVVSMAKDDSFAGASTSTGLELIQALINLIHRYTHLKDSAAIRWFVEGVICKVLLAEGGGWQEGKIRIRLEFTPDAKVLQLKPSTVISEPESCLDDLRSQLNPE